ncbi:pilus assembly protein CpaD [Pararobbsia alpina]|uniref:CpaD family pilus assembly lipoprotein n=1 Tax=Pararobbsia alpina TaxID=621374 RepID=UPI0039A47DE2
MSHYRLALVCASVVTMCALAGCFPAPRTMPDASFIRGDEHGAEPPDCEQLYRRSGLLDGGVPRPKMAWGCATYSNLAAQVVNPKDLFDPAPLGPTDANVAASAVRRYRTDKVTPLDTSTSRSAQ